MAPHAKAGPHELQLRRLATSEVTSLETLITNWGERAQELDVVIRALKLQAVEMADFGPTGASAAAAYTEFRSALRTRRTEILNVKNALEAVLEVSTVDAPARYAALGPAPSEPTATQGETAATQQAEYQTALEQREAKAKQSLDFLATRYDDAAAQMGHVVPDDSQYTQDQGTGGRGPLHGGSTTSGHPGTATYDPSVIGTTPHPTPGLVGDQVEGPGYTHPIPTDPGTLAGIPDGPETVAPALTTPGGAAGSGPGLAAGVALGAGGIGAAAIATLGRGGTGSLRPAKGVTLGGSPVKANPGTLGRGSGLLPGQSQGGRAGGTGKAGNSAAGRRSGGLLNGTGGRSSKDDKEKGREREGYDDPDGWLEDDTTTDGVLD